jgi:hypothetical protein
MVKLPSSAPISGKFAFLLFPSKSSVMLIGVVIGKPPLSQEVGMEVDKCKSKGAVELLMKGGFSEKEFASLGKSLFLYEAMVVSELLPSKNITFLEEGVPE